MSVVTNSFLPRDHTFHHMSLADDDLEEAISPPDLEPASGPQIPPPNRRCRFLNFFRLGRRARASERGMRGPGAGRRSRRKRLTCTVIGGWVTVRGAVAGIAKIIFDIVMKIKHP